ncbi:transketolase C-terminal domain-containing protein [Marispirochaeta aestuarii]|uniref:transketolase family protein n=1 Tax=Marispirochaeta aestuarii TaxID=1963862 RepID=UPI0029C8756D|nr:transketolase C-terminal domain-containing protein [Marispirochaeta aestuarii]
MAEMASLREAYGKALVRIGSKNKDIVALDADLGKSTFSRAIEELGEERFVEVGIAEQNMAAVSAGMAIAGKIPFFSSFAVFSTGRAYDQIRSSICIPGFNVNICGSSAGLSDYGDGKTHQALDDIAIMQVLPNMTVLVPADANQVDGMVEAMANHPGPCYIRIPRNELPVITEKAPYTIGQVDTFRTGKDLTIFSMSGMVHNSLEAAEILAKEGIEAEVVSLGTIKPFPTEKVREIAAKTGKIMIVEEHNVINGLGSSVKSALAGMALKIDHMGMQDSFGQSAESYELLLEYYGLTAKDIAERAKKLV